MDILVGVLDFGNTKCSCIGDRVKHADAKFVTFVPAFNNLVLLLLLVVDYFREGSLQDIRFVKHFWLVILCNHLNCPSLTWSSFFLQSQHTKSEGLFMHQKIVSIGGWWGESIILFIFCNCSFLLEIFFQNII